MATTDSTLPTLVLPDLLDQWPFKTEPNPRDDLVQESSDWVETFNPFDEKAQDAFNRCKFGIFAMLAYPHANDTHYRVCCDLMNLFFVYDEHSDKSTGDVVAQQAADIMQAMRHPYEIPEGGDSLLGAMSRDFWLRTMEVVSPTSAERFLRNWDFYVQAVVQEARDRDENRIRNQHDYFELRRGTIGVHPSYDYFLLEDDIPDECIDHPDVQKLACAAVDMTIISNDVLSWNVEQARDEDNHNLVAVAIKEHGFTPQEALDYIGKMYEGIRDQFIEDFKHIPKFTDKYGEDVDELVYKWCWYVGNWVTTNIMWSFRSERYFGKKGLEVLESRKVQLLPKRAKKTEA